MLNNTYKSVFSKINETHDVLTNTYIHQKSKDLKQMLKNDTPAFIEYLTSMKNLYYEDIKYPLFCSFETNDLFDILSEKDNKDIWEITNIIIGRYEYIGVSSYYSFDYEYGSTSSYYSSDYEYLKDFSNNVQNKFSKQEHLLLSERLILNFAKQIDSIPEPKEELDTKNTDTKSQ